MKEESKTKKKKTTPKKSSKTTTPKAKKEKVNEIKEEKINEIKEEKVEVKKEQENNKKMKLNVFSEYKKQYDQTKEKRIILAICFGIFSFLTIALLSIAYICVVYTAQPLKKQNTLATINKVKDANVVYEEEIKKEKEEIKKIEKNLEENKVKINEYMNVGEITKSKLKEKEALVKEITEIEEYIEKYNDKIEKTKKDIEKLKEKLK